MGCSSSSLNKSDRSNTVKRKSLKKLPSQIENTIVTIEKQNSLLKLNKSNQLNQLNESNQLNQLNKLNESNELKPVILPSTKSFKSDVLNNSSTKSEKLYDDSNNLAYKGNFADIASAISTVEIFDSINWIEKYKPSAIEFECLKEDLIIEYKDRFRKQVSYYFTNIQITIEKDNAGKLFTQKPENIFYIINTSIDAITNKLSKKYTKEMMVITFQLLRDEQRNCYDYLDKLEEDYLCALVNDISKMKDLSKITYEKYSIFNSDEITNIIYDEIVKELLLEYDNILIKTIDYLTNKILKELDNDYFSKLFINEWEQNCNDNCDNTQIFIDTLVDYFNDIFYWLNDKYKNMFIQSVLKQTLYQYVSSLKNKKNKSFINGIVSINKVLKDKQILKTFFSKYCFDKDVLNNINDFDIIDDICKIMCSKNFDNVKKETDLLCVKFGTDGIKFAKMAYNCNPANKRKLIL